MASYTVSLLEAERVPMPDADVEQAAGEALDAAGQVLIAALERYGVQGVTGDFFPHEVHGLTAALGGMLRAYVLNSHYGAALNADADDHPSDGYVLEGLEACAPESLVYDGDVTVRFAPEPMVHGFDSVTLYAPTRAAIMSYVLTHWGGSDEEWLAETLEEIRPVQADREYLIHLNVSIPADGSAPSAVVALDEVV